MLGYESRDWEDYFVQLGEKPYRGRQVFGRLHRAHGQDIRVCLADLPAPLKNRVSNDFLLEEVGYHSLSVANDGVVKLLVEAGEGNLIETVIIPEKNRTTLCVSSQVGCALACRFCLTGVQGFLRNLSTAEIIAQLRLANRYLAGTDSGRQITNVVMMGMGEPLLNHEALLPALRIMVDDRGYNLSGRRVTVSTSGIVPAIEKLRQACRVALAVSLHAPNDDIRDEIMPINKKYPLGQLMTACRLYLQDRPRDFITFEYVMIDGVNDGASEARQLVSLLHNIRCKVNLIPFNPFPQTSYKTSPHQKISDFRDKLMKSGLTTTIRRTRGDNILAACGQLAGEIQQDKARGLGHKKIPIRAIRS